MLCVLFFLLLGLSLSLPFFSSLLDIHDVFVLLLSLSRTAILLFFSLFFPPIYMWVCDFFSFPLPLDIHLFSLLYCVRLFGIFNRYLYATDLIGSQCMQNSKQHQHQTFAVLVLLFTFPSYPISFASFQPCSHSFSLSHSLSRFSPLAHVRSLAYSSTSGTGAQPGKMSTNERIDREQQQHIYESNSATPINYVSMSNEIFLTQLHQHIKRKYAAKSD